MKRSILAAFVALLVVAGSAPADVVITKKGRIYGLPSKINRVDVTPHVAKQNLSKSRGNISAYGYRGLTFTRGKKNTLIPYAGIVYEAFTEEDADWADGMRNLDIGDFGQALAAFQDCVKSAEARPIFMIDSTYWSIICLASQGNWRAATPMLSSWKFPDSRWTLQVNRILGERYIFKKNYAAARKAFAATIALPEIGAVHKLKAKLGGVKVDLAEKKFNDAKTNLTVIATQAKREKNADDVLVLIAVLNAKLAMASDDGNLEKAKKDLQEAAKLDVVDKAALYEGLGNVQFKMGDHDGARYAYLRVITMYPGEVNIVSNSLLSAGQCFLNLYEKAKNDEQTDEACQYLTEGMTLLKQAGGARYRNKEARKTYRQYKPALDALDKGKKGK